MIALAVPYVFSGAPWLQYIFSPMKNTGLIKIYVSNVMPAGKCVRRMLL